MIVCDAVIDSLPLCDIDDVPDWLRDAVSVGDCELLGVIVWLRVGESLGVDEALRDGVVVNDAVKLAVSVGVDDAVSVELGELDILGVADSLGDSVRLGVRVLVFEEDRVIVTEPLALALGVFEGEAVDDELPVGA